MNSQKKILIVGLFSKTNSVRQYLTAPEQLAGLFEKNNIPVLRTAYSPNKILRLTQIVQTILFKKKQFDIAIVPLYGTTAAFYLQAITSRLLKIFKKKIIITVHGGSIPGRMQKGPSRFLRSLKRADHIVTPSVFLHNELNQYNIRSSVIENVIAIKDYPFTPKKKLRPKVLWMRTFEDIYDPFMAIDVAAKLAEKYDDLEMVMAGADKGLLASAKKYAQEKGLKDKICFPGFISHSQKVEYAQDHDFFISTNRVDNAPVSLIEFMALGLVVIAANAGGVPYIIENNRNGFLVNTDDAAAMAGKITELIEAPELAQKIACTARRYAEQYDEDVVMEKWVRLLQQCDD